MRGGVLCLLFLIATAAAAHAGVEVRESPNVAARAVTFRFHPPGAVRSVSVAGAFNDWDVTRNPMTDADGDGVFETALELAAPGAYQYKYVLDGERWELDPDNPARASSSGFENSVIELRGEAAAAADAPLVPLRVIYEAPSAGDVRVLWGLNGWLAPPRETWPPDSEAQGANPSTRMIAAADGRFIADLWVPRGSTVDFVFHVTAPVEWWDNNGGDGVDYHAPVPAPSESRVVARLPGQLTAPPPPLRRAILVLAGLAAAVTIIRRGQNARRWERLAGALAIGAIALAVRLDIRAAVQDEIDEYDYVPVSQNFAWAIRDANIGALIAEQRVAEHPRMAMMLYSVAIAASNAQESFPASQAAARRVAVWCAALTAFALALRFPLAGLLWAVFGLSLHYTSVAYLDSPAALFATVCILAFDEAARRATASGIPPDGRRLPWPFLALSAVCAGLAVSTKYLAAVAPLAVAAGFALWLFEWRKGAWRFLLCLFGAYVAVAIAAMWAGDCALWTRDAFARIAYRFRFHEQFATGDIVTNSDFPWYQPAVWLWSFTSQFGHHGWQWLDRTVTVAGVLGLAVLWRRERRFALAWSVTAVFLLAWPTKWPQYETVFIPWLCVSAEAGVIAACRGACHLVTRH